MLKIGVVGPLGRMGKIVVEEVLKNKNLQLSSVLVRSKEFSFPNILATSNNEEFVKNCNIIIDFSSPTTSLEIADLVARNNKVHIIATTGFSPEQEAKLISTAKQGGIFVKEANMSLGVNLLKNFIENAAKILDQDFDIEISETHHRYKKDAPSGTALLLGKAAASGRNVSLEQVSELDRNKIRTKGAIGFSSIRAGDVIGDHKVMFANDSEIISFEHRALSRNLFAKGAITAAIWAAKQKSGLYSMKDVLSL